MADNLAAERHEANAAQAGGELTALKKPGFLANLTSAGRKRIKDWKDKRASLTHARNRSNERAAWLRDERPELKTGEADWLDETKGWDTFGSRGLQERGLASNEARGGGEGRVGRASDRRARRTIEVMPREQDFWSPEPTYMKDHPTQAELDWAERQKQIS